MTDTEFISFIKQCTLSNEEIAEYYKDSGITALQVRSWRGGGKLPDFEARECLARELSMLEHIRLKEQIQAHNAKRGK